MRIFAALRYSEWSMKRKLFGYMFLLAVLLLLSLLSGLLLIGRFDSAGKNAYEALDLQIEVFEKDVFSSFDRLAAAGIQLSEDTAALLDEYCTQQDISFDELNDAASRITAVQTLLLEPLRQKLLQENCSGIFVMLDATANSTLDGADHSRTGLYLQRSGYKTPNKNIFLYRGLAEVGRRHDLVLHNNWKLEFRSDVFPNYDKIVANAALPLDEAYLLTELAALRSAPAIS